MRYLLSLALFSSLFSLSAFGSGVKLLDATCRFPQGPTELKVVYWSTSAPGGPVNYTLEITKDGTTQIRVPVTRRPQLHGSAILIAGTQVGGESELTGHVVFYTRNNEAFLDVDLAGAASALNTGRPQRLLCLYAR